MSTSHNTLAGPLLCWKGGRYIAGYVLHFSKATTQELRRSNEHLIDDRAETIMKVDNIVARDADFHSCMARRGFVECLNGV